MTLCFVLVNSTVMQDGHFWTRQVAGMGWECASPDMTVGITHPYSVKRHVLTLHDEGQRERLYFGVDMELSDERSALTRLYVVTRQN